MSPTIVANHNPDLVVLEVEAYGDGEVFGWDEPIIAWRLSEEDGQEPITASPFCWSTSNSASALHDRRSGACWQPGDFRFPTREEAVGYMAASIRRRMNHDDRERFRKAIA